MNSQLPKARRRGLLSSGIAILTALSRPGTAQGEALQILSSVALEVPLREVVQEFTARTGRPVETGFGVAGVVAARLRGGETADLVLNTAPLVRAFGAEGLVDAATVAEVGRMEIGLAVRAGAPAPDIATLEALRAALLAAPSIALSDASRGATSAVHLRRVLEEIGLAEALAPRIQVYPQGVDAARAVAEGQAALTMTMISEIRAVPGAALVAPLPAAVQLVTLFAGAVTVRAKDPLGAGALLRLAAGSFGAERFRAAGFAVGS